MGGYRELAQVDDPSRSARRLESSERVLRPASATIGAIGALVFAFGALVGSATGDFVTPQSRVAAFLFPVFLGLFPAAIFAGFLRIRTVRVRAEDGSFRIARDNRSKLRVWGVVYLIALCVLGGISARRLGIAGPPPPAQRQLP